MTLTTELVADDFAGITPEGPFGYKPDRDQPLYRHFDEFDSLDNAQAQAVHDVRVGLRPNCVVSLPGQRILIEHAGTGYFDETTQRQWGYTIRRMPVVE